MLSYKCPTCKTLLANKIILYEKELEEICNRNTSPDQTNKIKQELLIKYEFINICCRMRAMSYVKLINIIK